MKFTNKQLAEAMGLKVGDKVKLEETILKVTNNYGLEQQENKKSLPLWLLVNTDRDFEIIKLKKKVGELTCQEVACESCPLSDCCCARPNESLFNNLEAWYEERQDEEIYDILKARLNKEV